MNKYELMVIVNAHLGQTEKENVFKQATDVVTKNGGKVVNNQLWLEKHKPPFMIKKCREVSYYLIKFESIASAIEKIQQAVRLNEEVLRFLIVRAE